MRPSDPPRDKLLELMHAISEGEFACGWRFDLEFDLWSAMRRDERRPRLQLPSEDLDELGRLDDEAGGWWVHVDTVDREWRDGTVPGRVFLSLNEWRAIYDAGPK